MFDPHPAVQHPMDLRRRLFAPRKAVNKANDFLASNLAIVFGSVWTVWVFFIFPLVAKFLSDSFQQQTSYYAQSWIQLFALPLFVYVGNKLQKSSDAQSEVMHQALTHIANVSDQNTILIEQNTVLTQQVHDLTASVHHAIAAVENAEPPDSSAG